MASDKYLAIVDDDNRKVVLYNKKGLFIKQFPFQSDREKFCDRTDVTMFLTDDYLVFIETDLTVSKQIRIYPQNQLIHMYSLTNTDNNTTKIFLLGAYSWANCDEKITTIYKLDQHQQSKNCSLHQLDFLFKTNLKVTTLPIICNE